MLLEVDNRENSLINELKSLGETPKVCTLDVGDIRLSVDNNVLLIIERKTINDLEQSIKDGRYKDQKQRLISTYDKTKIMYIVEGDIYPLSEKVNVFGPSYDMIRGGIINTMIRDGLKVVLLRDVKVTAKFLQDITQRVIKDPSKYFNDGHQIQCNRLELPSHKRKDLINPENFDSRCLCIIPGVSQQTAESIIATYGTLYNLIDTVDTTLLANIKLPSGRRLGDKLALKIVAYLKKV
jgi:ERCC4-type nuclease